MDVQSVKTDLRDMSIRNELMMEELKKLNALEQRVLKQAIGATQLQAQDDAASHKPVEGSKTSETGRPRPSSSRSRPQSSRTKLFRIPIQGYRSRYDPCSADCPCFCHKHQGRELWNNLFFGNLFIGYSALSRAVWNCNLSSCKRKHARYDISVGFVFPR